MDDSYSFGAWLRRRRKALDLTQAELARFVGVAAITIQKIEADERRPSLQVAELLADQLQVPVGERELFLATARGEQTVDRLHKPSDELPSQISRPSLHLPTQCSSFIGRQREQAELSNLLQRLDVQLVTLTGAGGSGKTRLALRVVEGVAANYADGVWFVDLSVVRDTDQVAPTIAQALGIPQALGITPRDQLISWLQTKHIILVLDNFEHIIESALLVNDILRTALGVRVIVTSRIPLRITGEWEYTVAPLTVPPLMSRLAALDTHAPTQTTGDIRSTAQWPTAAQLLTYDAVQLLVERAHQVKPVFTITNENVPVVAALCSSLEGLPLAIELAAARLRLFTVEQLLAQLAAARLQTLTGGVRDLPVRQRTIRATINWSYGLLSPAQQCLLDRLGVFVGGWTLAAAQAVCGDASTDVIDGLDALIAHSLIHIPATVDEARYTMLETIREFALERLRERGETEQIYQLHALYFTRLAEEAEPKLRSSEQVVWLARLNAEYDNLHAVVTWCLQAADTDGARQARGRRLAVLLWRFWLLTNRGSEALTWLDAAWVRDPALPVALRAQALVGAELIHDWVGALRLYLYYLIPEGLAVVRSSGDRFTIALALAELTLTKTDFVREHAITYAEEAQGIAIDLGDAWLLAYAQLGLGAALHFAEQKHHEGLRQLRAGLVLVQQAGDRWLEAHAHWTIGLVLLELKEYAAAQIAFERQITCYNELGVQIGKEFAVWGLVTAVEGIGLIDMARDYQVERARYAMLTANHAGVVATLIDSAIFAIDQGEYVLAADELRRSRAILQHIEPTHRQYLSIVLNLAFSCSTHVVLACDQGNFIHAQQELAQFDHYVVLARAAPLQEYDAQRLQDLDEARAMLYGLYALIAGDLALARQQTDAARAAQSDGDQALMLDGLVTFYQGNAARAIELLAQVRTNLAQSWGGSLPLAILAVDQGRVCTAAGDLSAARAQYHSCLPYLRRGRLRPWIAKVLEGCAALATLQRNTQWASRFWAAAEALREQIGAPMWPVDRPEYERRVAAAKAQVDPEEWMATWMAGRTLTWEQAADAALAWLSEVQELTP